MNCPYDINVMCNLFLEPLSKPLPETERGFDSCSPTLAGKGLRVRFERKLHTGDMDKNICCGVGILPLASS
jgi:hypothetical protein